MTTGFEWNKLYQGARWVRVDFHLHSPGAHTFSLPPGLTREKRDMEKIIDQYVQQLVDQNIEIAGITDYQGVRLKWFEEIQRKASDRGIVILPGAEISLKVGKHGLHVLAIFAPETQTETINRVLTAMDRNSAIPLIHDDGTHRDIDPRENCKDALLRLKDQFSPSPLLIIPHPNDANGLLKTFNPQEAAEFIRDVGPDAIEGPLSESDTQRLVSTNLISRDRLKTIAYVSFSDPKRIEEIGTKTRTNGDPRVTYLKLSGLNDLNAVRIALRDHQILVRLSEIPKPIHTRIEGVEMDGIGFLGNLKLALNPELNVIIGGRGVGKSALLEAIRYGLDLPEHCPTDYRKSLVSYALTSSGKVTIYLRQVVKPGVERCYRVERVLDKSPQVYELDPSGEHLVDLPPISLLIDQAKPLFFGQRDLYEVAQSPKLRRQFLDDLLGREADSKIKEINILKQELQDNARELIELYRKRNRQEQVEKRLIEIEHDLRPFERLGVAEKLREETALTRDEERLKRTETTYRDFQQEWQDVQKRWKEYLQRVLDDLGEAESRQKHLLQEDGTQAIRVLQERLEGIFQQVDEFLQQAQDSLHNVRQRWNDALQNLNEELRKIRQELGKDTLDPSDLLRLTQEKEKLDNELKQLNRVEAELKEKDQQRRDLLQKLRHKRKEAFHLREKMAREITTQIAQRVKVEVLHQGQRREYAEKLEEFFRGSGILKKELENIAYKEQIADGIDLVELVRKEKKEVMDKTGLSEAQAKKLKNFFEQDEKCQYELQLLSPEDEVQVSLNVNNRWIPLEKLSAGQRATAMLLILLTQTQHLIIIDQPEDDLDNHFVYEDVVKMLRDQKGKRQIIVATHNPNIPVLAHGELIVALEAESDCSRIHVQGSMDKREVQDEVRRVMEGGDEAFRRRAEKYGWG